MTGTTLMPFGKYRGEPLAVARSDENYRRWLLRQPWFADLFPEIRAFLADGERPAGEPVEGKPVMRGDDEEQVRSTSSTRIGTNTFFRFEKCTNARLGFVARPRCLSCGEPFDVPFGSVQASFRVGNEFVGVACSRCAVPQSVEQ